ncbi:MAG: ATP synthase F1 subunit delta [Chloroflexota bacterium]
MAPARPRRYAEALFEIAKERGALDAWAQDLHAALGKLDNEQMVHQFGNPELQPDQVQAALQQVLGSAGAPEIRNLLTLLIHRRQLAQLPAVVNGYEDLVNQERHIEKATVRTAVPLAATEVELIQRRLAEQRHASAIIIEQQVDPGMVGGIVVRIGDTLLDGSVDARLATLRQALLRER